MPRQTKALWSKLVPLMATGRKVERQISEKRERNHSVSTVLVGTVCSGMAAPTIAPKMEKCSRKDHQHVKWWSIGRNRQSTNWCSLCVLECSTKSVTLSLSLHHWPAVCEMLTRDSHNEECEFIHTWPIWHLSVYCYWTKTPTEQLAHRLRMLVKRLEMDSLFVHPLRLMLLLFISLAQRENGNTIAKLCLEAPRAVTFYFFITINTSNLSNRKK